MKDAFYPFHGQATRAGQELTYLALTDVRSGGQCGLRDAKFLHASADFIADVHAEIPCFSLDSSPRMALSVNPADMRREICSGVAFSGIQVSRSRNR